MYEINQINSNYTDVVDRESVIPFVIVNDCVAELSLCKPKAVHFTISEDGLINQNMDLKRTVLFDWHLHEQNPSRMADVVLDNWEVSPSLYSVFIAYEGKENVWTEAQFLASLWLHEYIRHYIAETYGRWLPLSPYHVISLSQISTGVCENSLYREQLYEALSQLDDEMALSDALVAFQTLKMQGMLL